MRTHSRARRHDDIRNPPRALPRTPFLRSQSGCPPVEGPRGRGRGRARDVDVRVDPYPWTSSRLAALAGDRRGEPCPQFGSPRASNRRPRGCRCTTRSGGWSTGSPRASGYGPVVGEVRDGALRPESNRSAASLLRRTLGGRDRRPMRGQHSGGQWPASAWTPGIACEPCGSGQGG